MMTRKPLERMRTMRNVQRFFYDHNQVVRVVMQDNEPLWVAKDICMILEISNSRMALDRLDDDEKGVSSIDTPGGAQTVQVVNEPGLYSLILGSRKPEAKRFKRWITHQVLPSIRKNGAYMTPETIEKTLNDPDFIIGLATKLKLAHEEKNKLQAKIEADKPKVLFAESLQISKDSVLVADLAKVIKQNGYDIGEKRLFRWLRENGYLIKSGSEYNMPTQRSMNMKLFEIKITTRQGSDGSPKMQRTPKVTGKGQIYFINKFLGPGGVTA